MRVSRLLVDELRRHALTAGINSIASTTTGPVSKTIVEGDALCSASGAVAVLLTCHRFRVMALEIAAVNATLLAIFVAAYVAFQLIGREERGDSGSEYSTPPTRCRTRTSIGSCG